MNSLSANALLFNTHDLILVMAIAQYLLFAVLLETTRRHRDTSSHLLALILLLNACKALDTLLLWSDALRGMVLAWEPDILLLGGFAYWLEGPLLFCYVSSLLYRNFHFRAMQLLHLLPLGLAASIMVWQYYRLPDETQIGLMRELHFLWSPVMNHTVTLRSISIIAYGCWCLRELGRYRQLLRENYANTEDRERRWLHWFIGGFVIMAAWALAVHAIGNRIDDDLANKLGIGTNYLHFFFVNSLVFVSIRYTHLFDGIDAQRDKAAETHGLKEEQIARVTDFIANEKPYLDPNINMQVLAKRLSLPERTFSRILNQHFGKNFFEFINEYRVGEAKRLLADPEKRDCNMLDILAEAGFSSKSTFNAIFKKYVGQTPSQYRRSPF